MSECSKNDIQKAIIAKYGSQKALADKMDTTSDALSNRIKRASNKFVKELEVKYGVDSSMVVITAHGVWDIFANGLRYCLAQLIY